MAAKKKKASATKYQMSRQNISEKVSVLIGILEDANVFDTSPNELDARLNELLGELESLCDDVHTKAF